VAHGGTDGHGGWVWLPQGTVASGVGAPSSEIQFADIDGDHKVEYLNVDPTNGTVKAWQNGGPNPNGGWIWQGQVNITAASSGFHVAFADMNGAARPTTT
jgi:hypothetical protein